MLISWQDIFRSCNIFFTGRGISLFLSDILASVHLSVMIQSPQSPLSSGRGSSFFSLMMSSHVHLFTHDDLECSFVSGKFFILLLSFLPVEGWRYEVLLIVPNIPSDPKASPSGTWHPIKEHRPLLRWNDRSASF